MKKVQLLSLIGLAALVSACGNQNPNPAAYAAYNNPYGVNGAQTGYYPNNGFYNNGYNNGWYSQPVAVTGSIYQTQMQVAQGQAVNFSWGADIICDRKNNPFDTYEYKSGGRVTNAVYTLNGSQVAAANGVFVAPSAGTLIVVADLDAISGNLSCGWSGNRPYRVVRYWVQRN